LALHTDRTPEDCGDPLNDGQAQADSRVSASARFGRAIERLEDVRPVFSSQAETLVYNGERDRIVITRQTDVNGGPRCAVLAGVIQQVVEQLAEQGRVTPDPYRGVRFSIAIKIGCPPVGRPGPEMLLKPRDELEGLEVGPPSLGLRPRHEEQ
jgi:hypothetical protein